MRLSRKRARRPRPHRDSAEKLRGYPTRTRNAIYMDSGIGRASAAGYAFRSDTSSVTEAQPGRRTMLYWALVFLIVAIIAAVLGFGGIAAAAAGIAKILFYIFLIVFLITLVLGISRRGRTGV